MESSVIWEAMRHVMFWFFAILGIVIGLSGVSDAERPAKDKWPNVVVFVFCLGILAQSLNYFY